ncbi:alanyl-tRNA editing protein [Candidatus Woesearchaeota archaeon]|nr:alanyl-tRNA editing protein [Candidatus Woesearchaeota archaeon]
MKPALYLKDSYMKEFSSTVESVKDDKFVVLMETAFYPNMGGQPYDTGKLLRESDGSEFPVVYVGKFDNMISHEVLRPGLKPGDKVKGVIDWDRRYKLMRMHTAAHVLARVLYNETGANTSGNQLGIEQSRIDFTLEGFDKDRIISCIKKANEIIKKGLDVRIEETSYEKAIGDDDFSAPSKHLMPKLERLRVINIKGLDKQACGGTHLKDLSEIGAIIFIKAENKGKSNRRIYFSLQDP